MKLQAAFLFTIVQLFTALAFAEVSVYPIKEKDEFTLGWKPASDFSLFNRMGDIIVEEAPEGSDVIVRFESQGPLGGPTFFHLDTRGDQITLGIKYPEEERVTRSGVVSGGRQVILGGGTVKIGGGGGEVHIGDDVRTGEPKGAVTMILQIPRSSLRGLKVVSVQGNSYLKVLPPNSQSPVVILGRGTISARGTMGKAFRAPNPCASEITSEGGAKLLRYFSFDNELIRQL